jgi:hypothetical protein
MSVVRVEERGMTEPRCSLCGYSFRHHGYSGPCPEPAAVPRKPQETDAIWADEGARERQSPTGTTSRWNADATIAQFRLKRIADFIEPSLESERNLYKDKIDDQTTIGFSG